MSGLQYAMRMLNSYGITSIQDASVDEDDLKAYRALDDRDELLRNRRVTRADAGQRRVEIGEPHAELVGVHRAGGMHAGQRAPEHDAARPDVRLVIDLVSGRASVDGRGSGSAPGTTTGSDGRVSGTFQVRQSGDQNRN